MRHDIPRLCIAGASSGSGKTTVSAALLKALSEKISVCAFKSGPDYIDPMFHRAALGIPSFNLDLFLMGEEGVKDSLVRYSGGFDMAVLEGAMGFYDGVSFENDDLSVCDTCRRLDIPALLVIDTKGMGHSLLAVIEGFLKLHPNTIKGVILNRCKKTTYPRYKAMIEGQTGMKVYGFMPENGDFTLKSRHLGLVTAEEDADLEMRLSALKDAALECLDLEGILALARSAPALEHEPEKIPQLGEFSVAVAKDKAFCFYYEENLDILRRLGGKITYFSPLENEEVPKDADLLLLGGGYPELYAERLSENGQTMNSIRDFITSKGAVFAECGGMMYLGKSIEGFPMCGILPSRFYMTSSLKHFGYGTLCPKEPCLGFEKGESVRCHQFHYSSAEVLGGGFTFTRPSGSKSLTGFCGENLYAAYPHIHFSGNMNFALHLAHRALKHREGVK